MEVKQYISFYVKQTLQSVRDRVRGGGYTLGSYNLPFNYLVDNWGGGGERRF